jgi:hypothetical protein
MNYLRNLVIGLTLIGALAAPARAQGDGAIFMEGQMISIHPPSGAWSGLGLIDDLKGVCTSAVKIGSGRRNGDHHRYGASSSLAS